MTLESFGWDEFFQEAFQELQSGYAAGRVSRDNRDRYTLFTAEGEIEAILGGRYRLADRQRPVAGDWVAFEPAARRIVHTLRRRTSISRKKAGAEIQEQVLAANVEVLFLVMGLDGDFNPRRMERYLSMAWESGAAPVVVLNKTDVCADPEAMEACIAGAPVLSMSALRDDCAAILSPYVKPGQTAALLGSSGVGKSTIVNRLLGEAAQPVEPVRASDQRGRHTTTGRHLFRLDAGWLLLDTPGLRELQLWSGEEGLDQTFGDLAELAARCRFRDCRHQGEPGCAVQAAVEDGALDAGRLQSYAKLQREIDYLNRKQDEWAALEEKRRIKRMFRSYRHMPHR